MPALTSLVIPVFNEADSIEPLVAEIDAALGAAGLAFEVVFVDDGSTDGSFAAMERLAAARDDVRVVKLRRNFGKAAALAHGFETVRGDYVVTLDGDRQDDPAEIPGLIARLDEGYDLVSGWKQSRQDPLNKTVPSRFFNWTVRRTSGIPLHDFNCGLKAYRRDVVDTIHVYGEQHRYIPVVAAQAGFRVTEEPVSHRPRTAGKSKYGWQRYLRGYLDLLTVLFLGRYQHRPQHLFGGIGTLLILIGVLVELYLSVDKLVFGSPIGQRPLLLLGALLIIVGVQLLSLGLIGDELANQAQREQLHADDDEQRAQQQQRALPDGAAEDELVDAEIQLDKHADEDQQGADAPEEMLRAVLVATEKEHREKVEIAAKVALPAVLGLAGRARPVTDRLLGDAKARLRGHDGDVAVLLAVDMDRVHHVAAVGLEAAVEVVQGDPRGAPHRPVEEARGDGLVERVLAALLPARDQVVPLVQARDETGDLGGVVLAVAVERDHVVAAHGLEAVRKRGRLAEVAPQLDDAHVVTGGGEPLHRGERAVGGPIVDEDDLKGQAGGPKRRVDLRDERLDAVGLVEDRDDE